MAHALAAGEQAVGELLGIEPRVAPHVLEPLHGVAGGVLEPQRLGAPLVLVGLEGARQIGRLRPVEDAGERDRVLHGELGARADGEVGGVRGVADQHQVRRSHQRSQWTRVKLSQGAARCWGGMLASSR